MERVSEGGDGESRICNGEVVLREGFVGHE